MSSPVGITPLKDYEWSMDCGKYSSLHDDHSPRRIFHRGYCPAPKRCHHLRLNPCLSSNHNNKLLS